MIYNDICPILERLISRFPCKPSKLRHQYPPYKPVYNGRRQNRDTHDCVQPIWETGVTFAARWSQEWSHKLECLSCHEKHGNRQPYFEWTRRIWLFPAEIEQSCNDKEVDNSPWVPLNVEDKTVSVSKRDGNDDDERGDEMQNQASAWRAERP